MQVVSPGDHVEIVVTSGRGIGCTEISAFDAALWDAGIGDYNLLPLSSVIPAGSEVVRRRYGASAAQVGWRLYCVLSVGRCSTHRPVPTWVGLGWASRRDRGGVFIEETASTRTVLVERIETAFVEMSARRGAIGNLEMALAEVPAPAPFSCAIVAAVYLAAPWS